MFLDYLTSQVSAHIPEKKVKVERPIASIPLFEKVMKNKGWMSIKDIAGKVDKRVENTSSVLNRVLLPRKLVECQKAPGSFRGVHPLQWKWVSKQGVKNES